jgi:predicted alpha/beta hydrolase family esterase
MKRVSAVVALVLVSSASPSYAQANPNSPHNDYADLKSWLCHPQRLGACNVDLATTVVAADSTTTVERAQIDPRAPVDCFYVYPTVSTDTTDISDMNPDAAELNIARLQFARFGAKCRLFAPLYRQATLASLQHAMTSRASFDMLSVGYQDVLDAWHHYLAHENNGRGVVLVGHSQGSVILARLIVNEIEGKPEQSRVVSAMLIGMPGGILVPRGRDVGGTFQHMPFCRSSSQTGCIVAYSSFRATAPPEANARFGRSRDSSVVVACTNPATLGDNAAELRAYLDANGKTAIGLSPRNPWTVRGASVETPTIRVAGMLTGRCTSNEFASYLEVTLHRGAESAASRDIQGDVPLPGWGLHLVDMEIAMGNLLDLVSSQTTSYLASRRGK